LPIKHTFFLFKKWANAVRKVATQSRIPQRNQIFMPFGNRGMVLAIPLTQAAAGAVAAFFHVCVREMTAYAY